MAGLPSVQNNRPSDDLGSRTRIRFTCNITFYASCNVPVCFFCYISDSGLFSLQTIKDNCTYTKLSLTQD